MKTKREGNEKDLDQHNSRMLIRTDDERHPKRNK
jgi:hypothetical protein